MPPRKAPVVQIKRTRGPDYTNADDERMRELHADNMTPRQIAAAMGRTLGATYARLNKIGLGYRAGAQSAQKTMQDKDAAAGYEKPQHDGIDTENPLVLVRFVLGQRLTMRGEMQMLDGHPTSLDEMMIEGNRVLKAMGREKVGKNPKRTCTLLD